MARPGYFIEQTWASLRLSWGLTVVTSLTIGVALVLVGGYWSALQSIETLSMVWGRHAAVVVYADDTELKKNTTPLLSKLQSQLTRLEGVAGVRIVTPKQALKRFAAQGQAAAALVEGVPESALPASLEIVLESGFSGAHKIALLGSQAAQLSGVEMVDYGQEDLEDLERLVTGLRRAGLLGGLLLLLATAFIVGNTIRLTVYSRRDEVAVLRLVGATPWFIRLPFVLEGGVWGFLGAVSALLVFAIVDLGLGSNLRAWLAAHFGETLADAPLLTVHVVVLLGALGPVVGCVGSWLAVGRFIDEADA